MSAARISNNASVTCGSPDVTLASGSDASYPQLHHPLLEELKATCLQLITPAYKDIVKQQDNGSLFNVGTDVITHESAYGKGR